MENTPKNPGSSSASSAANKSSQASSSSASAGVNRQNTPAAGASGYDSSRTDQSSAGSSQRNDVRSQNQNQSSPSARQNQSGSNWEQREDASRDEASRNSWISQTKWQDTVNQLPQSIKDLGSKAAEQFNKLSTTQKVVGGALLLGGISYLASRSTGSRTSNLVDTATRRARDYRSGNIPRPESSWNKQSSSEANRTFRKPSSETDTRFGSSSDYDNVL